MLSAGYPGIAIFFAWPLIAAVSMSVLLSEANKRSD
jgi:hypothetical protein